MTSDPLFLLAFLCVFSRTANSTPTGRYGTTNYEIMQVVRQLEKNIRILENKLSRHELRESQVADFSTKTLNALTADHGDVQKTLQTNARQMTALEEKMIAIEALITTTDERIRNKLDGLSGGLDRLLIEQPKFDAGLPPISDLTSIGSAEVEKEVKKVVKKVNSISEAINREVTEVRNEVHQLGESLRQRLDQLATRHDRLWNDWNTCNKEQISAMDDVTKSLAQTRNAFVEQMSEAKKALSKGGKSSAGDCSDLKKEMTSKLDSLDKAYKDQEKHLASMNNQTFQELRDQKRYLETLLEESKSDKSLMSNYFNVVFENLNTFREQWKGHLGELETTLRNIIKENSHDIKKRVEGLAAALKTKTSNIINALDDTAAMSENIHNTVSENFNDLTRDIRGLKKVEQVMLSTADAVLDTKRSIEFGIQQVILELSDAVKNSGQNINSTLSDQINNISFAILKNQTTALTNMTRKMEDEISQVWRQIGIMYQQIAQSVDILDEIQSSTSQHMNVSLDKQNNMDGTVGAINNKVADVEDNLNYLLGRLSLVVSEFSQMKTGVGAELQKLRQMAQEFSGPDINEYQVNKKRSVNVLQQRNVRKHQPQ